MVALNKAKCVIPAFSAQGAVQENSHTRCCDSILNTCTQRMKCWRFDSSVKCHSITALSSFAPHTHHCLSLYGWECVSAAALCEAADTPASAPPCTARSHPLIGRQGTEGEAKAFPLSSCCLTGASCIGQPCWSSHAYTLNHYVGKKYTCCARQKTTGACLFAARRILWNSGSFLSTLYKKAFSITYLH